ncbi:tetratricopeptide repeat protein, partial [Escherichia coli]
VAVTLRSLADVYFAKSRYSDAEQLYQRALKIQEKRFGPDHAELANTLSNLASILRIQRKFADAELLLKRALAIREASLGDE